MRVLLKGMLKLYRWISPCLLYYVRLFGIPFQCKFPISCSEYAMHQLENEKSLINALSHIVTRLWMCSPWGAVIQHYQAQMRSRKG